MTSTVTPNIKTCIKYSSGEEVNVQEFNHHYTSAAGFGLREMIKRSDVFDKTKKILNDDILTLCCYITAGIATENVSNENPVELKLRTFTKCVSGFKYTFRK